VKENIGTSLFLFAQSFTAVAHAVQKQEMPPFGHSRLELRQKFKDFPFKWI